MLRHVCWQVVPTFRRGVVTSSSRSSAGTLSCLTPMMNAQIFGVINSIFKSSQTSPGIVNLVRVWLRNFCTCKYPKFQNAVDADRIILRELLFWVSSETKVCNDYLFSIEHTCALGSMLQFLKLQGIYLVINFFCIKSLLKCCKMYSTFCIKYLLKCCKMYLTFK